MKGLFHSKKDFIPIQNKRRQTGEKSSENRTASFIAIGLNSQAHMLKTQHYIGIFSSPRLQQFKNCAFQLKTKKSETPKHESRSMEA